MGLSDGHTDLGGPFGKWPLLRLVIPRPPEEGGSAFSH